MSRRTYDQICGLATALDVIGERWTLLIVRDLALGPLRYTDILGGLPGIGDSLLSQRLRHLEAEQVLRRSFSAEQGGVVYELTDDGMALARALIPLARWGYQRMAPLDSPEGVRTDHMAILIASRLDGRKLPGVHERYELRVDERAYTITVDDGKVTVERGPAVDAVVRVALDVETFMALGLGRVSIAEARDRGRSTIDGDPDAIARWTSLLTLAG